MQIFVSYRRAGDLFLSGRLSDSLRYTFGETSVFYDVDSIPIGVDFRDVIRDRINESQVVLAVIGPQWNVDNRLGQPDDWVRLELEEAMRQRRQIIPLLVANTSMPDARTLPTSLQPLTYVNAMAIRPDPDFRNDMARLVQALKQADERARQARMFAPPSGPPITGATAATAAAATAAAAAPVTTRHAPPMTQLAATASAPAEAPPASTPPTITGAPSAAPWWRRPIVLGGIAAVVLAGAGVAVGLSRTGDTSGATVLPTSIAATSTTAAPTTTTTVAVTTTVAPVALVPEQARWSVACDFLQHSQRITGALPNETVQVTYEGLTTATKTPFDFVADASGTVTITFACGPGADVAWVASARGVTSGRTATVTIAAATAAPTTTSTRPSGATTGTKTTSANGATSATASPGTAPAQTTPVTAATTAATTTATTARPTTTLRPG